MQLEVVTPRGTVVSTEVSEVTAPGIEGEFGALPGHTPFITALRPGILSWRTGSGSDKGKATLLAVGAGYAEVSGADKVVVITRAAVRPDEINAGELKAKLEETERSLREWKEGQKPTREELTADAAWIAAQLELQTLAAKQ